MTVAAILAIFASAVVIAYGVRRFTILRTVGGVLAIFASAVAAFIWACTAVRLTVAAILATFANTVVIAYGARRFTILRTVGGVLAIFANTVVIAYGVRPLACTAVRGTSATGLTVIASTIVVALERTTPTEIDLLAAIQTFQLSIGKSSQTA